MVELKDVEIQKAANRWIIHIPKVFIEGSNVLNPDKKYKVTIEEIPQHNKGLSCSFLITSGLGSFSEGVMV